ncbi:MAG: PKD domain-containing protein, partial [candidate division WOR-3 bacterium]
MKRISCLFLLPLVAQLARAEPPTSIKVTIPDYTIIKYGDDDKIELPGGLAWLEDEGCPEVPYYFKAVDYPDGYRIQEVTLKSRTGEETRTGLSLPIVIMDTAQKRGKVPERTGVFPTRDFTWNAVRNPDGSTQLGLIIFPFFYSYGTRELRAYKNFEFEVRYIRTSVSLADVTLEQTVYDPGATIRAWVKLNNTGKAQPVVATAEVARSYSGDRIATVSERRIEALGRSDSVALEWSSGTSPAGDYQFLVKVKDQAGNELDSRQVEFRIGRLGCEVTSFAATPTQYKLGDPVKLSLEARNTGSAELSGQAVFEIRTPDSLVQTLTQEFARLAPGTTRQFTATWNTKSATRGQNYDILGYIRYDGTTSLPGRVKVSTNAPPRAICTITPETAKVDQTVAFDASGSNDSDGSIVEYRWDISDGASLSGATAEHAFS